MNINELSKINKIIDLPILITGTLVSGCGISWIESADCGERILIFQDEIHKVREIQKSIPAVAGGFIVLSVKAMLMGSLNRVDDMPFRYVMSSITEIKATLNEYRGTYLISQIGSAQQGDAPEPASPAR